MCSIVYHWWYSMQVVTGKSVPHEAHDVVNVLTMKRENYNHAMKWYNNILFK